MTLQTDIVREKVAIIRKELHQEFRAIPFKIRVVVARGRIDVYIKCAARYDQERMTPDMEYKMQEIALRYSETTHLTEEELLCNEYVRRLRVS